MDNLVSVIGPAPSELSWDALRKKLQIERERMRKAFEWWNSSVGRSKASGRKKGLTLKDIKLVAKSTGMTVEAVEKMLTEEIERRTKNGS